MKYKTILINFMQEKNLLVKKHSGLVLTTKADIDELQSWSEDDCSWVTNILNTRGDRGLCPWCILKVGSCTRCGYGERNLICASLFALARNSRYGKILSKANVKYLLKLPGMYELARKYINLIQRKAKYNARKVQSIISTVSTGKEQDSP